jgi:hypothetical protein
VTLKTTFANLMAKKQWIWKTTVAPESYEPNSVDFGPKRFRCHISQ